ncbi:MAG: 50S ribosomal protein L25 [Bacteroidales bacterium]|nr:50S ribosomal protein L25 [Bacteroidales bacterium]
MKSIKINATERKELGKKATKAIRKQDHIPCVMYGQKQDNIHFHAHKNEFRKIIYTPNSYIVDLNIGKNTCQAIMQSVDFHPVTDEILHIDFYRIDTSKKLKIGVPVKTTGFAKGIQDGGVLNVARRKLLISATAENMPDEIVIDITDLGIGDAVRVDELNEQYKNLDFSDPQSIVVSVNVTRLAKAMDEEELEGEEGEEGEEVAEGAATTEKTEDKS